MRGRTTASLSLAAVAALAVGVTAALSGAPAQAAFPGTNGKIFCPGMRGAPPTNTDQELFSVNPDGTGETVITDNTTRDGGPAISPDGTKIAFESSRSTVTGEPQNPEIYVADNDGDLNGPDVKRLTFNKGQVTSPVPSLSAFAATDFSPSWSADGTQIVFHSGREASFPDLLLPNPTSDVEIYKMSATVGEDVTPATRLTTHRGQDAIPSWSPDGRKIAFQRLPQTPNPAADPTRSQNLEIYTMNPDGTGQTNVSNSPGTANNPATVPNENSDGLDRDAIWSPDSSQLAFSSTRTENVAGNQNFEVWRMTREGQNPVRLTSNPSTPGKANDFDVPTVWSPDGTKILFTSSRASDPDGDVDIAYTMDAVAGESAGVQPVARTVFFQRCDWQAIAPPAPPPGGGTGTPPGSGTGTTPGGGTGSGGGGAPGAGGSGQPGGSGTGRPDLSRACGDATRPRSSVSKRSTLTRRRIGLNGRTTDRECSTEGRIVRTQRRLARVEVSIATRNAGQCRFLTSGGRLTSPRSCATPVFVRVRVVRFDSGSAKSTWQLAKGVRLPRGTYTATVRGVDRDRNVEVPTRKSNRATFRVR